MGDFCQGVFGEFREFRRVRRFRRFRRFRGFRGFIGLRASFGVLDWMRLASNKAGGLEKRGSSRVNPSDPFNPCDHYPRTSSLTYSVLKL
jgi:hypothetical protein